MFNIKQNATDLKLSSYDYKLPKELIAQKPVEPRDESRLLVIFKDAIWHTKFKEIIHFLQPQDVIVLNNTKVIKSKLIGKKSSGGKVELTIIEKIDNLTARCFIHAKNPKIGTKLIFNNAIGEIIEQDKKIFVVKFNKEIDNILQSQGNYTLPPYIKEKLQNPERYQTVFASKPGSLAAPTAGLHFTEKLLKKIKEKGVMIAFVTLDVGLGTFEPVVSENILEHKMHEEYFEIDDENAKIIKNAKRLFVIGTTSLRVLESLNEIKSCKGVTKLFIYPGYRFKHKYYGLITNFHLPKSTLLMLVSAIVRRERILKIYKRAVELKYRFFSLGDATLILNDYAKNYENLHKNNIEII